MKKFYRVKKDSFLWQEGAILESKEGRSDKGGYSPIDDMWDATEHNNEEYITAPIVENNPEWFERVWAVSSLGVTVYVLKEKAKELFGEKHK